MSFKSDKEYWTKRYHNEQTAWDLGEISAPLKAYIDQLENKKIKILIPGAGNAYEAAYFFEKGFKNTFVLDISEVPLESFKRRNPNFPQVQLIQGDFFKLEDSFDLIIEQTFFCALDPALRSSYVKHMHHLLKDDGKLVGVLFDFPLTEKGPPFGGNAEGYAKSFEKYFEIVSLERAYNSVSSREGKELFVNFVKKTE